MTDAVAAAASSPTSTSNLAAGQQNLSTSYDTFLQLLTTQLQNQDPTSPLDTNQFTQQLVQMTGVQQQLYSNELLQQLVTGQTAGGGVAGAVGLIGKTVTASSPTATLGNGQASWDYSLGTAAGSGTATIKNSAGAVVWTGALPSLASGQHTFSWNGKSAAGVAQANGDYTLSVAATDPAGQTVTTDVLQQGVVGSVSSDANGVELAITGRGKAPLAAVTSVTAASLIPFKRKDAPPMSISSSLLAGVSGLIANSSALAAISDNIANVNTTGYKREDTQFQDLVTASSGNLGAYTAGGTQAVTRQLLTQQGEFTPTQSGTDLAIQGDGFFVTTTDPTGSTATQPRAFTRAGSFTPDKDGYLENAAGLYLQGWVADANGDIATDASDISKLQTINVNSLAGAAGATTSVSVNANLDASQPVSAAATAAAAAPPTAGAYDATSATTSMATYSSTSGTGTKPDFTIPITVTDSQGGSHSLELRVLKSATPNQWSYELVASPASQVVSGAGLHDGQLGTGTLAFTPSGQLDPAATTGILAGSTSALAIGASGAAPAAGAASWATSLGIAGQTIGLNLATAPGGMTQFASDSVESTTNNGVNYGNLSGVTVDNQGFVTATYDNGVTRKIAQVAIATFPNADGLKAISGDAYQVSLASGAYDLRSAGTGGAGQVEAKNLENSTVDLSTEFTGLITTQRAYSASSKIITTTDSMLQDLIDIVR